MSDSFDEVFTESGPHRGAWLCYINGLEVPIVGWQVEYGVWQIPTATIHLFPERCVERIGAEDRVQVAIFYLDHWAGPHSEFRLMFDGEVIGWSYQHSHGQRTIALSCQAHIQIFQQLFFFYMTTMDDVVAAGTQENLSQNLQTAGFFYPYELFHQGLVKDVQDRNKLVERPFDLVYNVIAGLISTRVPTANRSSPMLNFFSRWVRRTRFYNRWVCLPVLEDPERIARRAGLFPIFRAVRNVEALNAMQRRAADTANRGPVWDLLKDMLDMVYMEIQMLPTAPCVKTELTSRAILGPLRTNDPLVDQTQLERDYRVPSTTAAAPVQATLDAPRLANSLSQETATTVTSSDIYRQALNRVMAAAYEADPTFTAIENGTTVEQRLNIEQRLSRASGLPSDFANELASDIRALNPNLQQATQRAISAMQREWGRATASELAAQQVTAHTNELQASAGQRVATPGDQQPQGDAPTTYGAPRLGTHATQPVTLAQYSVKPQMFFGVAPSCNVLYPSMIESWTYDENYAMQPTRLYVNDSLFSGLMNGRAGNTSASTFASIALTVGYPEEADAVLNSVRTQTPTTGEPRQSGKNMLIWAEEFFKGPVTARATLPQWFQMLTQLRNSTASNKTGTDATPDAGDGNGPANPRNRAREHSGTATNRWNNNVGDAVRSIASRPDYFPGIPPEFFVGFTATNGRGAYRDSSGSAFGLFSTEGGVSGDNITIGPTWTRLRNTPLVRAALGRAATDNLQTALTGDVRDDVAVSLARWRLEHHQTVMTRLRGLGVEVTPNTQFYAAMLFLAHAYSTAITDLLTSQPEALAAVRAANGSPNQWRDLLRVYADGGTTGKILAHRPTQGPSRYRNRFHALLRATQELEAGRLLANNPGAHGPSSPQAVEFFNPRFASPDEETAVYATLTRLGRVPTRSRAAQYGQDGRPVNAAPPTRPTAPDDEAFEEVGTPDEEVAATEAGPAPAQPNGTPTAPPRPITDSSTGQTVGAENRTDTNVSADEYQRLFRVYAQYEYLRQRYDKRRGGAQLAFNPYVVPGYPMHLFDRMTTEHHVVGYIMSVSQSGFVSPGAQANLSTQVTYSFGRTVGEFLADVRRDALRFSEAVASAPAEVIDEIRTVIQDADEADNFYNRLLYAETAPRRAAFRFVTRHGLSALYNTTDSHGRTVALEILGANSPSENRRLVEQAEDDRVAAEQERIQGGVQTQGTANQPTQAPSTAAPAAPTAPRTRLVSDPEGGVREEVIVDSTPAPTPAAVAPEMLPNATSSNDVADATLTQEEIDAHNVAAAARQERAAAAAVSRARAAQPTFDGTHRIVPSHSEQACFENYDTAMRRVARPICTLAEYVRFWHGGRPINELERAHVIERGEDDYSFATVSDQSYRGNSITGVSSAARDSRTTNRATAQYWKRIYTFRQGSANMAPPDKSILRSTQAPGEYRWVVETGPVGNLPPDFPETRDNWDKWLVKYRDIIRYKLSPQR